MSQHSRAEKTFLVDWYDDCGGFAQYKYQVAEADVRHEAEREKSEILKLCLKDFEWRLSEERKRGYSEPLDVEGLDNSFERVLKALAELDGELEKNRVCRKIDKASLAYIAAEIIWDHRRVVLALSCLLAISLFAIHTGNPAVAAAAIPVLPLLVNGQKQRRGRTKRKSLRGEPRAGTK